MKNLVPVTAAVPRVIARSSSSACIGMPSRILARRSSSRIAVCLPRARSPSRCDSLTLGEPCRRHKSSRGNDRQSSPPARRVEPDARCARHKRVFVEAGVGRGIGYDEDIGLQDRVSAEGEVQRYRFDRNAYARLEPFTVARDEADEREGRFAQVRRERREIVEGALGRGVENLVSVEHVESG